MPRHERPAPAGDESLGTGLRWDAIIVAGGRATRLGGIDKTALVFRGRTLLDGVLAATASARRTCVVGSDAPLPASVLRTVEQPRWGGPAAAIVAGLAALDPAARAVDDADGDGDTEWIVVLAADLVNADGAVAVLLAETERLTGARGPGAPHADGVIAVDASGRRQPLLAVYRRAALRSAAIAHGPAENLSVMSLIGALTLVELRLADALSQDVDTPADAAGLGIEVPGPAATG